MMDHTQPPGQMALRLIQSRSVSGAFYVPDVKEETLKKIEEVNGVKLQARVS